MKIFLGLFILLIVAFFFLQGNLRERNDEKPFFLIDDLIAKNHHTKIDINIISKYHPNDEQLAVLKADYSNIWAHLNNLYQTNQVEAGKEYYTEDWFKQVCTNYEKPIKNPIQRIDISHELILKNWATDALVCTALDKVIFIKRYPDQKTTQTIANIGIVLHFQGDHWRIDAMRILNESTKN
jgi:hypothetical protein